MNPSAEPTPNPRPAPRRRARAEAQRPAGPPAADASAPPRSERMSRVDHAWWRMDNDVNLMMIVAVWHLKPGVSVQALRARVAERLLPYARFAQRVVHDELGASWVDCDVDLTHHVVEETLPVREGQSPHEALKARCGELAHEPLDPTRPLWQWHLVTPHEGGSALIARIHHCIGDGIALVQVLLSMTDEGEAPKRRRRDGPRVALDDDPAAWLAQSVVAPLAQLSSRWIEKAGGGLEWSLATLAEPGAPARTTLAAAHAAWQVAQDAIALAALPDDSRTGLKGTLVGDKRVAWNAPLALDRVKAVGRALGASVNDVVLACVAGALGAHLRGRGEAIDDAEIRAMVPVNLRPLEEAWKLGNRFGLVPLVLPIGLRNPVACVVEVQRRMAALKGSFQPVLAFGVLAVSGLAIKPVQDMIMARFSQKTTAVMTNVPGPREALTLCGARVEEIMFWVPASGQIGVGVSVLSYAGKVQFGLMTDAAVCDDPQRVVDGFEDVFRELEWAALMLPWGDSGR